jgi:hypothetical protein
LLKLGFVLAQLRDMLAAEDSAVVTQEDNYGIIGLPQRAEPDLTAASFRQHNIRQLRAETFRHATDCIGSFHRPGRLRPRSLRIRSFGLLLAVAFRALLGKREQ